MLYKYEIVGVEDLIYIWTTSINKHELIVALLYSFWNEMAYAVNLEDIVKFFQVAIRKNVEVC